jgi:histidine triad (HIT) family protein
MDNCIFCQIGAGEIPATIIKQDDLVVAFQDINPQSPTHIQIIPKKHIESVLAVKKEDAQVLYRMLEMASLIARENGLDRRGFRLVFNCGPEAGQTVPHLHLHLLGGRPLGWPPG